MEQFRNSFPIQHLIGREHNTGKLTVIFYPVFEGVKHEVQLVVSDYYPDDPIDAYVLYPKLNHRYMDHHWFGPDQICYVDTWSRRWTILKVGVQVMCWLTDYYKEKNRLPTQYYTNVGHSYGNQIATDALRKADELLKEIDRDLGRRRFFS